MDPRRRILIKGWGTALLLFYALGGALAADKAPSEPPLRVRAEVDRAFLTIGDPVTYQVTIKRKPEVEILSSIPPPPNEIFSLKKTEDINRKDPPYLVEGKKFQVTSYRLGEFVLDPIEIEYRIGKGPVQKLATEKIYLTVKSVAEGEEKKDIRGLKSVFLIPFATKRFLFTLGIVLLVIGGIALFIYFKRKGISIIPPPPPIEPADEALNRLTQLYESDFLRQGKIKEYHLVFSEILRTYLEKRFQILAAESTTGEILKMLRDKEIEPSLREKIRDVLEQADLAKFAKWKPAPSEIQQHYQQAREIVDATRPKVDHVPVQPS